MASKIALAWLASQGIAVSHTETERSNFATGSGFGTFAMPYHIVATDSRYGTSKRTVDWAVSKQDALDSVERFQNIEYQNETSYGRGGGEFHANRVTYYATDIRTGEIVVK